MNPFLPNYGGAQGLSIHLHDDTLLVGGIIIQEDQRGIGIFLKYDLLGNCLDTIRIPAGNDSMYVNIGRVSGTELTNQGIVMPLTEFTLDPYDGNLNGDSIGLMDFSGQFIWRKAINVEEIGQEILHQVRTCSDGYYLIGSVSDSLGVLYSHNVQGLLIKTDAEGNMLWHQRYPQVGEFNNIIVLENDDVILGGYTWNSSNGLGTNQLILKADSQGNEQWRYDFGGDSHDGSRCPIQLMSDGKILSVGNVAFIESYWYSSHIQVQVFNDLSEDGFNVESSYIIDPWPQYYSIRAATKTENDGFACVGLGYNYQAEDLFFSGMLLKLNAQGDSLWARYYSHGENGLYHWLNSIVELPDHGFAMAGLDEGVNDLTQIWVLRVDSMGCIEPGCHLISGLQEQLIGLDGSMTVFPNPVTSGHHVNLQFKPKGTATMPYNSEASRLLLFDLQGRLVLEEKLAPTGSNEGFILNLDLPILSRGTYTLHWISEDGVWYDGEKVVVD